MQPFISKLGRALGYATLSSALACGAIDANAADNYPSRPIRIEVPFAAGGAIDILARAVSSKLSETVGGSVIVEDRPGAGGNIAADYVSHARPDGYTVLLGANGLTANMSLFHHLDFDALKDLAPVAYVGYAPLIIIVGTGSSIHTLSDLISQARAQNGKLTFATAGYGSSGHLATELFNLKAGVKTTHVPYKGGAPALLDIEANRVGFMFLDPVQVMPQMPSGKLRPIAVSSPKRLSLLPNVPTVSEAGMPGFNSVVWWGFLVPAKTPPAVITKLNTAINQALADPKVKQTLEGMGVVIQTGTPAKFGAFLKSDYATMKQVTEQAHLSAD